eukprot:7133901-Ditylum_brightwellii.AAC.1
MTFVLWLKSMAQIDHLWYLRRGPRRHRSRLSGSSARYITPYKRGREVKVIRKRGRWKKKPKAVAFFTALPMLFEREAMAQAAMNNMPHRIRFDSDSFLIGIDNHASYCMSNKREHFEGPLRLLRGKKLRGIACSVDIIGTGTLVWQWEDDTG